VLVRGVSGIVGTEPHAAVTRAGVFKTPTWPDEAARAFAVEFAATFLEKPDRDGTDAWMRALSAFGTPEIADALVPQLDPEGRVQRVVSAATSDAVALDSRLALITVAARVTGDGPRTVRLTVPIARDAHGGLVVSDLASLAPAPARAAVAPPVGVALIGDERAAIGDVLTRFLRAYVSGDTTGLAYLMPPGTRIAATGGGFELLDVGSLSTLGPDDGARRLALATVHVHERASGATYALRYRVRLVRRERWYVAAINEGGG
jgi:hypothetical protein